MPARKGDGTGLAFNGFAEARLGDGTVLWSAGETIPASAISRYAFNDDATDAWGSNDGTLNGDASFTTDAQEGSHALTLDGDADYVQLPAAIGSIGPPLTIVAWVYLDSTPGDFRTIAGTDDGTNGYSLGVNGSGEWDWTWRDGVAIRDGAFVDGQWYHVAGRIGDGSAEIRVDNLDIGSDTYSSVNAPTTDTRIGDSPAFSNYWPGRIDLLDFYDKKLSNTEIQNHMDTGSING